MKKLMLCFFVCIAFQYTIAQEDTYPVFDGCENKLGLDLENCFNKKVTDAVIEAFRMPENVVADSYKGTMHIVFLVNREGNFEVLYTKTNYEELENEAKRVFKNLPTIKPATYNGRPVEMRFGIPISIPLGEQPVPKIVQENNLQVIEIPQEDISDAVTNQFFPEHNSELNIPFTHSSYTDLDFYYNKADNAHTASKPYSYSDASTYVNLDELKTPLFLDKSTKAGKKLFNEHFFTVQKKDYWITINPMFDLQLGKDNSDDIDYTYNNTRAIRVQGGLGKNFNFSASIYESQGRFAGYINDFAIANRPSGSASFGLIPGRGKAKDFKTNGFDYPVAEAYLSYTPNKFFNFQFGHGKNFIGDGYRSFMLSDVASPYPFLKVSTKFWKIKYTNTWMWLDDVRPEVNVGGASARKYVAMHHLSWNVNKRLNIGLFEAVVTNNETGSGFDVNFFNPIIFYRAVEFTKGSDAGNALLGLNAKYKLTDNISAYSQFILDELTVGRFFDGDGYWGNKFAFQIGAKYHNAFKVDNLFLQGELNIARPYTFAHQNPINNYGHFNQPLGHLWGSNFWEIVGITRYKKGRWFGSAKIVLGEKGFDANGINYGGNIYESYNDRLSDTGNNIAQGNQTSVFIGDLQAGYVVNPTTNLQLFGGLTFRNFNPTAVTQDITKQNTTWFTVGLRTDVFNWYFDF